MKESSFTQLTGTGISAAPEIKEEYNTLDLRARMNSQTTKEILNGLENIATLMSELNEFLNLKVTNRISVYKRVTAAIDELVKHIDNQISILFGNVGGFNEHYIEFERPSVELLSSDCEIVQHSLARLVESLKLLRDGLFVSDLTGTDERQQFRILKEARNTYLNARARVATSLTLHSASKQKTRTEWHITMREDCAEMAFDLPFSESIFRCLASAKCVEISTCANDILQCIGRSKIEREILNIRNLSECYWSYGKYLAQLVVWLSSLVPSAALVQDDGPIRQLEDMLSQAESRIHELARGYSNNRFQVSDLVEAVSSDDNEYHQYFKPLGLSTTIHQYATDPLLKYASDQQVALVETMQTSLIQYLGLSEHLQDDTHTITVAKNLAIWLAPVPNLEVDKVGEFQGSTVEPGN